MYTTDVQYRHQRAATQVSILAHFFGVIAIVLMLVWLLHYRGGLDLDSDDPNLIFNVHPFLMFFGFIFMAGQAMMAYKTVRAERKVQKFVHAFFHSVALCLGIVGLHAAFKFHERSNIPNLYSLHSWIGITTFSLFCLQWLFGITLFLFPSGSDYTRRRAAPWHRQREARLINFLGLSILIFGIAVDISVVFTRFI
ncbi:unnamed protein product [Fraxinus pennsylvanica]|uniref:ascorbate ferrireductase (transmembrane) n=1 Tax=Fraxinus pennsylvanica TaxID=56036 RepID=A0AAD2AHL8_9LAMI|nr:unnamed protein product [Fraxinus pennsylvanica]